MWHASIAYHGNTRHRAVLHQARLDKAIRALRCVGDATLGEWVDHTPAATHLRRRLSTVEAVGFVLRDVRGTAEAEARLAPLRHLLPVGYTED